MTQPILIDTLHCGRARAIGCWDLGGVLVDPGPESCIDTVLEAVAQEPRALLLTHIHLDHAGATGALVRRFPEIAVWVHERGAPHLIDPSKLVSSAGRLYGERMEELWGEIIPVPEGNISVLEGGETIDVGGRAFDVTYTPGHAYHHVAYFDPTDRTVYAGDVAGIRIPPSDFIMAPTPPPDIDVELWLESIELVRALEPARIALTHFGMADDPTAQLDGVARALERQAAVAKQLIDQRVDPAIAEDRFAEELEGRLREEADPDTAATAMQAVSPRQVWMGLKRYWENTDRADAASGRSHDRVRDGMS
jgi:glyoxylase-like metal-dependent hydrolase (beta-lactamase superfamily II)